MITIPDYLNGYDRGISTYTGGGCCSNYCEVHECANCEGGDCMSYLDCNINGEGCGTCMYTCESISTEGCSACESGEGCGSCQEDCQSCQEDCQSTCETDCQSFCEAGYQNIGIYSNNSNQQVVKIDNIKAGVNNKNVSILQAYAKINDRIKLVYDAIDNIIGIAIVANGIFNTDSLGVRNTNQIEKYEWYGELSWTDSNNRIRVNNNLVDGGAGLEGKLYFKLKDGTYIDNEELINILNVYHKFIINIYTSASSSSSITIFGKNDLSSAFTFTKDTMLNLNFSLSAWSNDSYYSGFRIGTARLDGRDLSVEFFDKTPELSYYANVNNIEKAIIKINFAQLSAVTSDGKIHDGSVIATDRNAYQIWITTYGGIDLYTMNGYSYCQIYHNSGSSINGYSLYLSGNVYIKYKDGTLKYIDDTSLMKYFIGTCRMEFDDYSSNNSYHTYSTYYLNNDSTNMLTTKTFDYPSKISDSRWHMSIGRYRNSGSAGIRSYFYNLKLNNIGLLTVSIPTEFEIDPTWL